MNENEICAYPDCNLPVNFPHDSDYCFGHASIQNKGMDDESFDKKLREEKIYRKDFNFDGFVFSSCFTFPSERPVDGPEITLKNCKFFGAKETNVDGENVKLSIDFYSLKFNASIKIENCFVENCSRLDFARFNSSFIAENVEFKGDFLAKKITCTEITIIRNSIFRKSVKLNQASFNKDVLINNCIFSRAVVLYKNIFNSNVSFDSSTFQEMLNLREGEFKGDASFQSIEFLAHTNFNQTIFSKFAKFHRSKFNQSVSFYNAKFDQKLILTYIVANKINLSNLDIKGELKASNSSYTDLDLSDSTCTGQVDFVKSCFKGECRFDRSKFIKVVDFTESSFIECSERNCVSFHFSEFRDRVIFDSNNISSRIIFNNITQTNKTTFYFTRPKFTTGGLCVFKNIQFEPFTTYFEYIQHESLKPLLIFRYCNLKDVFFSNNNLSLFSFYKSVFDEARFILPNWDYNREKIFLFHYFRKNIIYEDYHFNLEITPANNGDIVNESDILLEDFDDLDEIASLYRRFKTALDKTKDYEQAGWFYFNELEMKRKGYGKDRKLRSKAKFITYSIYKTFAGYGEKPLWSFLWFIFFTFLYSVLNLFGGFNYNGRAINYDLFLNQNWFNNFNFHWINDWLLSVFYTFLRIIPFSYSPFTRNDFSPSGLDSIFLSFTNSIILLVFATFTGIGLKRIFRRF